jgi:transcriptional regulator with XRE-family HTH domain
MCTINPMSDTHLRREVGQLVQRERESAGLSPAELAARAGLSASTLGRIERGTLAASVDTVDKIFCALGLRLRLSTESVADDLDAQLDRLAMMPLAARLARSGVSHLLETLDGFGFAIDGALAANLHGVPLPVETLEIAVGWAEAEAFNRWLVKRFAYRWHERTGEFRGLDLDPRAPGPHYWQTSFGKVRARMSDELPAGEELPFGGRTYRVLPLAAIDPADDEAAGLLRRYRDRQPAAAPTKPKPTAAPAKPKGGSGDAGQPLVPVAAVSD